jgi:undecaprenyl diphosphate synthase
MNLLRKHIGQYIDGHKKNNMRFGVIGDTSKLDDDIQDKIRILEEKTKPHTGMKVNFAINYGGRDEITRAVRKIAEDAAKNAVKPDEINEDFISSRLDTANLPEPDLWIRTGGEMRLSNFLTWQTIYSELYFCDKLWPDFTFDDLTEIVKMYQNRERRFGGRKND